MNNNADLSIIILNYNTTEWVRKCLSSLRTFHLKKTAYPTKIIVVDNGSADQSIAQITKDFPEIELMELPGNVGFAAGNNAALHKVKTKYAMLLNSDTEFTAETHLDKLLDYAEAHPEVGVLTPKIQLSGGGLDWASHRGEPTPWASLTYFSKLEKLFPQSELFAQYHQSYKDLNTIHHIDACSGAAMIIQTGALEKVGYLDESFFMYGEDLDWCHRFRAVGYSIVYFPESVIIHYKYKSGLKNQDKSLAKKTKGYFYDTMLQYYDKYYARQYPGFVRSIVKGFINFKKESHV